MKGRGDSQQVRHIPQQGDCLCQMPRKPKPIRISIQSVRILIDNRLHLGARHRMKPQPRNCIL